MQLGQIILGKMTDHKVSDFVTKKCYHALTLMSKYLVKATSDTVSVGQLLLLQQLITVGCRCAWIWAMCLFSCTIWGTMLQSIKQMPYRDEYNLQVLKSHRMSVTSMIEVVWSTKCHGKLGWLMSHCVENIYWVFKNEIWPTKVMFDGHPGGSSTKKFSSEIEEIIWQ